MNEEDKKTGREKLDQSEEISGQEEHSQALSLSTKVHSEVVTPDSGAKLNFCQPRKVM